MSASPTLGRRSAALLALIGFVITSVGILAPPPLFTDAAHAATPVTVETVYEAEDGELSSGGAQTGVVTDANASGGAFARVGNEAGQYNTITGIEGGIGGDAEVTIRYAYGAGDSHTKVLVVNGVEIGNVVFASTSPSNDWSVWGEKTITVALEPGAGNTIQLINDVTKYFPIRLDYYSVTVATGDVAYEAEDGELSSGAQTEIVTDANASGGAFVRVGTAVGEYNTITGVDGGIGGNADVTIRYANGAGNSNTKTIYVNGLSVGTVVFASTSPSNDWSVWGETTITVPLDPGTANTIQLINAAATPYPLRLDRYTVTTAEPRDADTYYVDSDAGDDANDGTDSAAPWQTLAKVNEHTFLPGDQILLKAGSVWNGESLVLKGSGTIAQPIVLSSYGTGAKPQLNGNGQVEQLVLLRNESWWTIENLEITNMAEVEFVDTLMGVRVEAINTPGGRVSGITVQNIDVHSVNGVKVRGTVSFPSLIYFNAGGTVTPSAFDRVLVKDITTMNSIPNGLNFYSSNTSLGGPFSTNVHVDNVSGNTAQIYWMLDGALIENNRLVNVGSFRPQYNSNVFAAIFPTYSKNLTFQYNEIINTAQSGDSQGFDFDLHMSGRNVFQYNYTYGNSGALLVMQQSDPNTELIYRYNVSHNDASSDFRLGDGNVHIYNNVIYNDTDVITVNTWGDAYESNLFENNIFVGQGMSVKAVPGLAEPIFDSNLYYGFPGPKDDNKIVADPMFVEVIEKAGLAGIAGFALHPDSPARNTGTVIADAGDEDILGNPLYTGAPDRGAVEHPDGGDGVLPVADSQQIEVETGTRTGGAQIAINTEASGWNVVRGLGQVGASVVLDDVVAPSAGDYRVELRYSGGENAAEKALYVNDVKVHDVVFAPTDDRFDFATVRPVVQLAAGVNTVEIRAEQADASGATEVYLDLATIISDSLPIVPDPVIPPPPTYPAVDPVDVQFTEAEHVEIAEGGSGVYSNPDASGGKFATNFHYPGRYLTWHHVNGGAGGTYTLDVRYRTGNVGATMGIYVNGVRQGEVDFPTTGWVNFGVVSVDIELAAGAHNTVTLKNDEMPGSVGVSLDYLQLVRDGVDPPEPNEPDPGPNLVTNSGFESGATGWNLGNYFSVTGSDVHAGSSALQAVGVSGANSGTSQSITVEPYHDYRVTFWAKSTDNRALVRILAAGGIVVGERTVAASSEWTEYTVRLNAGNRTALTVYIGFNGDGTHLFDEISVQRVTDVPLYPNLVSNGEFDAKATTNWVVGSGFGLSNDDKYQGAASMRVDGSGSDETLAQTISAAANTDYTLSFWVRSPGGTIDYVVRGGNGTPVTGPHSVAASDGWVLVTQTFDSGQNTQLTVEFVDAGTGVSYLDSVQLRRATGVSSSAPAPTPI
ncbi:MAG: carbohydrate binding domain-containing protein [Microcella sp.]|uniref:carbohydrate binding domain-containing protein n=1 Tax=Microcella sp. TaxID=1913979 RepID=UPI0024CD9D22|nr:carbohydrate binding domain-containing protein [Microcella sp.]UYN84465.1 MAG: carbohydrate binding domain-containing protein [Microcella sp.]